MFSIFKSLFGNRKPDLLEYSINIYVVHMPDGKKQLASFLPNQIVFRDGLINQAIIGEFTQVREGPPRLNPANFVGNLVFVNFFHDVIGRRGLEDPGLQEAARHQIDGWAYLIDLRTPTPDKQVPMEDIIGGFEVWNGEPVPGSYQPNQNHRLLTNDGFFRISPFMQELLIQEVTK